LQVVDLVAHIVQGHALLGVQEVRLDLHDRVQAGGVDDNRDIHHGDGGVATPNQEMNLNKRLVSHIVFQAVSGFVSELFGPH
jgi:hypothetical protein